MTSFCCSFLHSCAFFYLFSSHCFIHFSIYLLNIFSLWALRCYFSVECVSNDLTLAWISSQSDDRLSVAQSFNRRRCVSLRLNPSGERNRNMEEWKTCANYKNRFGHISNSHWTVSLLILSFLLFRVLFQFRWTPLVRLISTLDHFEKLRKQLKVNEWCWTNKRSNFPFVKTAFPFSLLFFLRFFFSFSCFHSPLLMMLLWILVGWFFLGEVACNVFFVLYLVNGDYAFWAERSDPCVPVWID